MSAIRKPSESVKALARFTKMMRRRNLQIRF